MEAELLSQENKAIFLRFFEELGARQHRDRDRSMLSQIPLPFSELTEFYTGA